MDEVLIIASLASALICIILLVIYIARLIGAYHSKSLGLNRQTSMNTALILLDDIIKTSVITTNQTLVNNKKYERTILDSEPEETFEQYRNRIYNVVRPNQLKLLQPYMPNVDEWVNARIEYYANFKK